MFDLGNESLLPGLHEELLDVPGVLGASCIELEEHEVGGPDHEASPHEGLGSLQKPRLPGVLPDDHVERSLAACPKSHHASQRIGGIALPNVYLDTSALRPGPKVAA